VETVAGVRVLFILQPGPVAKTAARTLAAIGYETEWVTSIDQAFAKGPRERLDHVIALVSRLAGAEGLANDELSQFRLHWPRATIVALTGPLTPRRMASLLERGVMAIEQPVDSRVLLYALLGLLVATPVAEVPTLRDQDWITALSSYSEARKLSIRQTAILRMHFEGRNDKEIACSLGCGETTVYEHWRRIAKKAMVKYKREVLADFHLYAVRSSAAIATHPGNPLVTRGVQKSRTRVSFVLPILSPPT
jgi:DNA-binding NarL/FixJ family response regulator